MDIDALKEELILSFKDLLKGTQGRLHSDIIPLVFHNFTPAGEEEEILSLVPGGFVRTYTRSSTRRRRAPTLREKEWQRKIQSIHRKM